MQRASSAVEMGSRLSARREGHAYLVDLIDRSTAACSVAGIEEMARAYLGRSASYSGWSVFHFRGSTSIAWQPHEQSTRSTRISEEPEQFAHERRAGERELRDWLAPPTE